MSTGTDRDCTCRHYCHTSRDLRESLDVHIGRTLTGTLEHGPLEVVRGDWLMALLEELMDANNYIIYEILKRIREKEAGGNDASTEGDVTKH